MWAVEISACFLLRQLASGTAGPSAQLVAAAREIAAVCVRFSICQVSTKIRGSKMQLCQDGPIKALSLCAGIPANVKLHLSRVWTDRNIATNALRLCLALRLWDSVKEEPNQLSVGWCQVVWISAMIFLWNNTVLLWCFEMTDPFLFSATNIYIAAMALAQRGWLKS